MHRWLGWVQTPINLITFSCRSCLFILLVNDQLIICSLLSKSYFNTLISCFTSAKSISLKCINRSSPIATTSCIHCEYMPSYSVIQKSYPFVIAYNKVGLASLYVFIYVYLTFITIFKSTTTDFFAIDQIRKRNTQIGRGIVIEKQLRKLGRV